MIARKYGLRVVFEASAYELPLPFTKKQMVEFEPAWEEQVVYMRDCCSRLGNAVGTDMVNDPDNIWIALIGVDVQPLDLFLDSLYRNYDEVNEDFRQEYGFDLPLEPPVRPAGGFAANSLLGVCPAAFQRVGSAAEYGLAPACPRAHCREHRIRYRG